VCVGLILAAIIGLAVLAPLIAPADPTRQVLMMRLKPPGTLGTGGQLYLFGTDDLGRDLLSRVLFGAQASLAVALFFIWIFTNLLSRAFESWAVPLIGFFLLPWTTLAYALMWDSSNRVYGFEWFIVALGFFFDLASYSRVERRRRHDARA